MATLACYNPELPYLGLIPGGDRVGATIRLNGTMQYGGSRFSIYLQTGAAIRPRDDTALQLNVRPTEPVIVRNHCENKVWGNEERYGGCPIYPGQAFEISILTEPAAYKISINGVHFCHFNHRFSMHCVTFICADFTLTSITTGSDVPSAPSFPHPLSGPVHPVHPIHPIHPIHPYPPSIGYPGTGHTPHRPQYPYHPGQPGFIPGAPPPPPYSPTPYPGHSRYPYIPTPNEELCCVFTVEKPRGNTIITGISGERPAIPRALRSHARNSQQLENE